MYSRHFVTLWPRLVAAPAPAWLGSWVSGGANTVGVIKTERHDTHRRVSRREPPAGSYNIESNAANTGW